MKHATEKLKSMGGRGIGYLGPSYMKFNDKSGQFRDPRAHYDSSSSSDSDEDDKQSFHSCNNDDDEDPDEKRGGIIFHNLIDN